jgi:glycosyltransferase involved in cell wall biosynthesis
MNAENSKRITFLLPNLNGGGAERVFVELANQFAKRGFLVDLLLLQKVGVLLSEVSTSVNVVDLGVLSMYLCLPEIIRYLGKVPPDVLLATLEFTSLMALAARKISGVRTHVVIRVAVAVSQHKRSWIKKFIERRLLSFMYPWAYRVITVSEDTKRDLIEFAHLPAEKVQTIYNPVISQEMLDRANSNPSHEYYREGQPPVILGVGRLTAQKDFGTLIRAFDSVRKETPASLLILGEGEGRAELESIVHSSGLADMVSLPGYVINPFPYMKNASLFVLSSRWEGLPNALIQALACGCPVVSTNCPTGPMEILQGGKYGHLVPVGDVEALAQAILQSLRGDHRRAPADWLDQFKVEPVVQQYLNIINGD